MRQGESRAIQVNVILDGNGRVERLLWVSLTKPLVEHNDLEKEVRRLGSVDDFHFNHLSVSAPRVRCD